MTRQAVYYWERGRYKIGRKVEYALRYVVYARRKRQFRSAAYKYAMRERALILSETISPTLDDSQVWKYVDDNDGSRSR
jgi:hypothetical protein